MAEIKTERTLVTDNAVLSVGDEAWFKLKNTLNKKYWIYARIEWISDKQLKLETLNDNDCLYEGYILLPNFILEVSDKVPY